jgi:hypothetical protein
MHKGTDEDQKLLAVVAVLVIARCLNVRRRAQEKQKNEREYETPLSNSK